MHPLTHIPKAIFLAAFFLLCAPLSTQQRKPLFAVMESVAGSHVLGQSGPGKNLVAAIANTFSYVSSQHLQLLIELDKRGVVGFEYLVAETRTPRGQHRYIYCPDFTGSIKHMTGNPDMHGAILVVAETGLATETHKHVQLAAHTNGVPILAVYLNKTDAVDTKLTGLAGEVRKLLSSHRFDSDNTPIICGSASRAFHAAGAKRDYDPDIASVCHLIHVVDSFRV